MSKKRRHSAIWRQRATLLLVMFFCMLVSVLEYLPQSDAHHLSSQQEQEQESQDENQTFLNIAVDAVVPFVTVIGQQVLYLIYEIISFEKPVTSNLSFSLPTNIPYWEILLERIISTNAP
ncbi:hypothetical protein [Cecembia rubra]|uniref:hypothetical protein n=1 Tax=Cecembia rubra TaxID=1485585 RepID=UPI001FE799F1|nr:hypothetical protein [Cecembia rubra]